MACTGMTRAAMVAEAAEVSEVTSAFIISMVAKAAEVSEVTTVGGSCRSGGGGLVRTGGAISVATAAPICTRRAR